MTASRLRKRGEGDDANLDHWSDGRHGGADRAVPALAGKYVFGDYSRIFAKPDGRLFYMCGSPDVTPRVCNLVEHPGIAVFGFARDANGELYVLGNQTGVVSGSTGVVELITAG